MLVKNDQRYGYSEYGSIEFTRALERELRRSGDGGRLESLGAEVSNLRDLVIAMADMLPDDKKLALLNHIGYGWEQA